MRDSKVVAFDPRGAGFVKGDLLKPAIWAAAALLLAVHFFIWTPRHHAG